jgi:hypothetical protein
MAIPSQQIGWSQRAKLLWNISKQLENLIKVAGNVQLTTTSTTTIAPINLSISDSNCGSVITVVPVTFVTGTSLCSLSPLPTFSGDFTELPSEFYGIYDGQSRIFIKDSNTLIRAIGGAPGECIPCG